MIFDTDNKGTFFEFADGSGGVTIRVFTPAKAKEIEKKTTKIVKKWRRGQYLTDKVVDEEESEKLMWEYVIVDWKGVCNPKGEELPCTGENKIKLVNNSINFANFVSESLASLSENIETEYKAQEKN